MASTFKSFADLDKQIRKTAERAMKEVVDTSFEDAQNLQSIYFYATREPGYDRTGQFGRSARKKDPVMSGDIIEAEIYRDVDYKYPQGFPSSKERKGKAYGGYVPAQDVHEWAEKNENFIVGNPGTWEKTLEKIQENIDMIFGEYFSR